MMTRLGLGSYGVAWAVGVPGYEQPPHPLDTFGLLRRADELGLRLVQIADNLSLHELSPAKRKSLLAEAERLHIAVEVGTRGIQPDHLQSYLPIAHDFNLPILRVVVDTATHHPDPEEVVSLLRPQLAMFAAAGFRWRLRIMIASKRRLWRRSSRLLTIPTSASASTP